MRRRALFHSVSKRRPSSHRPAVEQLEDRLPPGDVVGLSGAALWGMSLAGARRDPWVAPVAIIEPPPVRYAAETSTAAPVRFLFSADVSVALGLRESTKEQAGATPVPTLNPKSPNPDFFDPGLRTAFDVFPSFTNGRALSKGSLDSSEEGHPARIQTSEGSAGGAGSGSSVSSLPSDPAPVAPQASGGSIPNMMSPGALPSTAKTGTSGKQTNAGKITLPPQTTAPVGNLLSGGQPGGIVNPQWGRIDTPPSVPT
jgi:hypothetical protein